MAYRTRLNPISAAAALSTIGVLPPQDHVQQLRRREALRGLLQVSQV